MATDKVMAMQKRMEKKIRGWRGKGEFKYPGVFRDSSGCVKDQDIKSTGTSDAFHHPVVYGDRSLPDAVSACRFENPV